MWLRDWLGPYLESQGIRTRILIYGYKCLTHGSISDATIQSMARQFLELLKSIRSERVKSRLQPSLVQLVLTYVQRKGKGVR